MQQCFRPDLTLKTQTKNKNSIILNVDELKKLALTTEKNREIALLERICNNTFM